MADALVELPVGPELWERVFSVAPLVLVGTKEGDGCDFAPKHMAMPLGWEGFYCFVCTPRARDLPEREGASAVHGQLPAARADRGVEPRRRRSVRGRRRSRRWPPCRRSRARVVDGCVVEGCPFYLECELERIVDGFGPNSLIVGRVVAASAAREALRGAGGGRRRSRAPARAARLPRARPLRRRARQPVVPVPGRLPAVARWRAPTPQALLGWLDEHRQEMVELLERLARAESPSLDPETQRGPFQHPRRRARARSTTSSGRSAAGAWAITCTRGRGSGAAATRASS